MGKFYALGIILSFMAAMILMSAIRCHIAERKKKAQLKKSSQDSHGVESFTPPKKKCKNPDPTFDCGGKCQCKKKE